jgi:N-acetyl-anhydromuramyl-L-alanine amidase AmpD
MREINLIVVHCSATPNGRWVSTLDIDQWHAARGFKRLGEWRARQNSQLGAIGYHFVLYTNGAIATGRHLDEIGAHVVGTDKYTAALWSSLAALVDRLRKDFPNARVTGHRDLSPDRDNDGLVEPWEWLKTCPGFDVAAWLRADMVPPKGGVLEDLA